MKRLSGFWNLVGLIRFLCRFVEANLILHTLIRSDGSWINLDVRTVERVNLSLWGVLAPAESSLKLDGPRKGAILAELRDAVFDVGFGPVHLFPLSPDVRFQIWHDFRRNVVELNRGCFHPSNAFLFLLLELFRCFRLAGLLELLDRGLDLILRGNRSLSSLFCWNGLRWWRRVCCGLSHLSDFFFETRKHLILLPFHSINSLSMFLVVW